MSPELKAGLLVAGVMTLATVFAVVSPKSFVVLALLLAAGMASLSALDSNGALGPQMRSSTAPQHPAARPPTLGKVVPPTAPPPEAAPEPVPVPEPVRARAQRQQVQRPDGAPRGAPTYSFASTARRPDRAVNQAARDRSVQIRQRQRAFAQHLADTTMAARIGAKASRIP